MIQYRYSTVPSGGYPQRVLQYYLVQYYSTRYCTSLRQTKFYCTFRELPQLEIISVIAKCAAAVAEKCDIPSPDHLTINYLVSEPTNFEAAALSGFSHTSCGGGGGEAV